MSEACERTNVTRVGVVGAGFAGLAAACELAAAGADVTVLEARERVGGRVWSQTLTIDASQDVIERGVIERGAEFVLAGYDVLREYAARLHLSLSNTGMSYYVREPRGAGRLSADDLAHAGMQVARSAASGGCVADVLARAPLKAAAAEAVACRIEISCAADVRELHSDVVSHIAAFEPLPSYRIAGGNQQLARGLAGELGDRVELGNAVAAVRWDEHGATVSTARGPRTFDRLVLALPAPVLNRLRFEPALPAGKSAALGRMVYGHAAKLHLPLTREVVTSAVMSVPDRFWVWTATTEVPGVQRVLHSFAGSPNALARLDVASGPRRWIERIATTMPEFPIDAAAAVLTDWTRDQWALGAYSAQGAQVPHGDERALAEPVGALHFAGEYLGREFAGLMEGALRSGRATARLLLATSDHRPTA